MFITLMRKHTKGILVKVMVGLIAVVFIFWGVYAILADLQAFSDRYSIESF